jgi:hypothetical protein
MPPSHRTPGNVYAYPWDGSTIGPITLKFNMFEKGTTELAKNTSANWAAGNINNQPAANISASLTPLNGGSAECNLHTRLRVGPGLQRESADYLHDPCVGLDIYELAIKIGTDTPTTDDFYAGTYEVIVAVSDPTAKLPSGGGFIQLDDSFGESRLNFGFNYSSQGGKASKTIKGGHGGDPALHQRVAGLGWVCRVKTNSLSAPTQTAPLGSTSYWYSSFSGTNVSYNCRDAARCTAGEPGQPDPRRLCRGQLASRDGTTPSGSRCLARSTCRSAPWRTTRC